jgi:hypothetical protein
MLKASRNPRVGFLGDFTYQVTTADSRGDNPTIAIINETKLTIDLGGQSFSVGRKGVLGPEYQLKSGDKVIATASKNRPSTTTDSGTSAFEQPWGSIMAVTIPLVILVMIFQYRIVAGLTAGAVKG